MDQRRARRGLWAIRLIVFPALIAGVVLLLAGRSSAAPEWIDGVTSQGGQLQAQLVDGRVARLSIDLRMRCPHGTWAITWTTRRGARVSETTTHHYRFHDMTGRRTITLDTRLDGKALSGTVTSVERFDEPSYGAYACDSGPITFSARPS